jgi:glycosyltransferase involved in cell wall biosynthesis
MLSILIPAYNQDIRELLVDLHHQAMRTMINFEILILDDGSEAAYHSYYKQIENLQFVHIRYNELNKGRSVTRNLLLKAAVYDYVLFIDADSSILSRQFLNTYIQAVRLHDKGLIYGGTKYPAHYRSDQCLHWRIGKKKEQHSAKVRTRRPVAHFHSNNYWCMRELHLSYLYDESINKYGYEDLELAHRISLNNINITHIDNPVRHNGLKSNETYLKDIRQSVKNISLLTERHPNLTTPLSSSYYKLKKYKLDRIFIGVFRQFAKAMNTNLLNCQIGAYLIDLYKVYYFALSKK